MLSPLMVIQYPLIAVYPAAIYSATSPDGGEITRQRLSGPLHRNRTAPPSLWPGFEFTEVSLALYAVIARTGAIRPLQEVLSLARIPPGSWRANLCGFGFRPAYRNVPDECVFNFRGAGGGCFLSSQGVAGGKN